MTRYLAGVLLLAATFLAASASTTRADILDHIDWIVANSDLEYNGEELPTIETVSYAELLILAYGPETVAQAEYRGEDLIEIEAVYADNVIYVTEGEIPPWVMVHETVHFLQDINGTADEDCVMANEPEAYLLHHQWQGEHGYEQKPGNVLYGLMLGEMCNDMYGKPWPR